MESSRERSTHGNKAENTGTPTPQGRDERGIGSDFLAGAALGAGGKTSVAAVDAAGAAIGKIKDVLKPKNDAPKIELPPGVEK